MKNTYSLEISAPAERVWRWINATEHLLQWLPNLVENEVLTPQHEGVGAKFRQVYLENGRRMEMHGEVIGFELNRYLACDIQGKIFDLNVDYRLAEANGVTTLTQNSEVKFKGPMKILGALMKPFVKKSSQKQADKQFLKLKSLVEAEPV